MWHFAYVNGYNTDMSLRTKFYGYKSELPFTVNKWNDSIQT